MNSERENLVIIEILKRGYRKIFDENWPLWLGGLLISIMSIITFAWARPWGVAGGLRNWGDWFFSLLSIYQTKPPSPLISTNSILTLGLLWGALGSALLSKQFAIRMAPPLELLKGVVGGILMGIGAAMAGGCNVGGFYSAISALSFSGLAMMVGLIAGAYVGLRYLYWELEHLPSRSVGATPSEKKEGGFKWLNAEPYIGTLLLIAAIICAWIYSQHAYTRVGVLLLCGLAFGIIIQRTRFCFVRGFRDPFMTGQGEATRAVAISVVVSMLGFAALKWTGLRPESISVVQASWFGGLVGGLLFGIGMVVAGGCGSGCVWRAGEGQIKLMLAVICFSLSTSLFKTLIRTSKGFADLMGHRIFLPDYLTYKWTVIVILFIMTIYYLAATWNEETDRFTVEI
ncbi:MAG: YeeE/YedE thiosulfate transporter family protein [Desulfatiglans sp.]|nr:YeeE/YedE thiosulfate transporter family protein [Thermodesulfobacteriota bacterium]MEE4351715.1 YeeE/YedE thiosulfate transporter family protein [Desulfatiglans sp.]